MSNGILEIRLDKLVKSGLLVNDDSVLSDDSFMEFLSFHKFDKERFMEEDFFGDLRIKPFMIHILQHDVKVVVNFVNLKDESYYETCDVAINIDGNDYVLTPFLSTRFTKISEALVAEVDEEYFGYNNQYYY